MSEYSDTLLTLSKGREVIFHRISSADDPELIHNLIHEDIAPFPGQTNDERIASVYGRLNDPNAEIFCLVDALQPLNPVATLHARFTNGICRDLGALLTVPAEDEADTDAETDSAMFCSLKSSVSGAAGVLLDTSVAQIKGVRQEIKIFSTLSPVNSFRSFLKNLPGAPRHQYPIDMPYSVLRERIHGAMNNQNSWNMLMSDPDAQMNVVQLAAFHLLSGKFNAKGRFIVGCDAAGLHGSRGAYLIHVNPQSSFTPRGWEKCMNFTANWWYPDDEILRQIARDTFAIGCPARSKTTHSLVNSCLSAPQGKAFIIPAFT